MTTKEIIKHYFKENELEILDGGIPYTNLYKGKYRAVSLNYIHKYVVKEKVSKRFVAKTIFTLCKEKYLFPIPCYHAGDIVFCKYKFQVGKMVLKKFEVGATEIINNYSHSSWHTEKVNGFNQYLK